MAQKNSKYAYNRNYYSSLARTGAFEGNAARRLEVVPDGYEDEELFEEELPREEVRTPRRREPERRRAVRTEREPRTKYRIKVSVLPVLVFAAAIAALLSSAFRYLEVQSDITQADKQINAAENRLADIEALNESLSAALDTEIDRNYIYTVAVAELGMVYPDKNQVVYYEPAQSGYVRQLAAIPME